MALPLGSRAQSYDVNDTVTEYPMKGTFYHNKFEGRKTASGEIFDQNLFTAAHWKIKKGTYVLVTNRNTGLQVIVKINDRCPRRGVLDMTRRAAHAIGIRGCQPVTVRILPEGYEKICEEQDAKFDSVPSRFATGKLALTGSSTAKSSTAKETKSAPSETQNVSKETKRTKDSPAKKSQDQNYNLFLGTAQTHGEAFEMIQKLPDIYHDKAIIDSTSEKNINILLDVRLSKKKANELCRALKHSFSNCQITPAD